MKITYNKNPLHTTIELDEHEKKELWYKIKIEIMEELFYCAHFYLQEDKHFDLNEARRQVNADYYCGNDDDESCSDLDKRCDALLEHYIDELQLSHSGDCTCVACSCSKCHAESLLGIDTIKGLGKHSAYKIDAAFGKQNQNTIQEALDYLKNYNPTMTISEDWKKLGGYEQYVPRWTAEAKAAYDWLLEYTNTHFKGE